MYNICSPATTGSENTCRTHAIPAYPQPVLNNALGPLSIRNPLYTTPHDRRNIKKFEYKHNNQHTDENNFKLLGKECGEMYVDCASSEEGKQGAKSQVAKVDGAHPLDLIVNLNGEFEGGVE